MGWTTQVLISFNSYTDDSSPQSQLPCFYGGWSFPEKRQAFLEVAHTSEMLAASQEDALRAALLGIPSGTRCVGTFIGRP